MMFLQQAPHLEMVATDSSEEEELATWFPLKAVARLEEMGQGD